MNTDSLELEFHIKYYHQHWKKLGYCWKYRAWPLRSGWLLVSTCTHSPTQNKVATPLHPFVCLAQPRCSQESHLLHRLPCFMWSIDPPRSPPQDTHKKKGFSTHWDTSVWLLHSHLQSTSFHPDGPVPAPGWFWGQTDGQNLCHSESKAQIHSFSRTRFFQRKKKCCDKHCYL